MTAQMESMIGLLNDVKYAVNGMKEDKSNSCHAPRSSAKKRPCVEAIPDAGEVEGTTVHIAAHSQMPTYAVPNTTLSSCIM